MAEITGAGGEYERWTSSILTFCCPERKGSTQSTKVWRLHLNLVPALGLALDSKHLHSTYIT